MKYRHALFLNPYTKESANPTMMLFPPTGLEYVASSAKSLVEKITLIDMRYEKEYADSEKLLRFIEERVDIVFVGIGWDRNLDEVFRLISRIPKTVPVVAGGHTATEKAEEILGCQRIDIVVRGEGERTAEDILKGKAPREVPGISYRNADNSVCHNPNRPLEDVSRFLPPDRSLRRNDYGLMVNGILLGNILFDAVVTTRGCPFQCKFCTFSLDPLGQKRDYSERTVESVVDEVQGLKADIILISDDNFFTNPRRAEKICDLLIQRKIKKRFLAQARIDIAQHPVLLKKLARAGFKALFIGIESPHDRVLGQLNKGFDQAAIREAFAVLRKYPILTNGYFIYGNIGETEEEMLYIAQFAREIGVDTISTNKLRIEKYSPLRELAEGAPGYHITDRGELYSDDFSHARLKKIGKKIKYSFYTPARYLRLAWKSLFVVRFVTMREILTVLVTGPWVLVNLLTSQRPGKK